MLKTLCALALTLLLTACGGGGGGGSTDSAATGTTPATPVTPPTPPPPLTNFATITIDNGPPAVVQKGGAYNMPFVTVTICAPGSTSNCQTIDHVLLDTGSVGLRLQASVLDASLLSALPMEVDVNSNPVGECYQYVDGYVFGSVRLGDFTLGGGHVSGLPLQVVGDSGAFTTPPSSCSSGAGTYLNAVGLMGANGIIGIGVTPTDCGARCAQSLSQGSASYYDCPTGGCVNTILRAASTSAPFEQLPNPIAALSADNNGSLISFPAIPDGGQSVATGTLYFGIGTETNNGLGAATVLTTSNSSSPYGPGLITVLYKGQTLTESFIDSGTNNLAFVDTNIAACTDKIIAAFYCPATPINLAVTLSGVNGGTSSISLSLISAQILLTTDNAAIPGTGFNPETDPMLRPYHSSFDLGMPFFYGRHVFTAIEGRVAAGKPGPFVAF